MANLINLSQIRQDLLNDFVQVRVTSGTGSLFTLITGNQITTGTFDNRFVHLTGNETVSGIKAFVSRPTFANTGLLASGEPLSLSQTGKLYPSGNPSGFTPISVTGSTPVLNATLTGIGGAQVIVSGSNILVSGGAGGSVGGAGSGVSLLTATGSINSGGFTGNVLLSGAGNITTFTGNQAQKVIVISGDTGSYANFVTVGNTTLVRSIQTTGNFPSGIVSGSVVISGAGVTLVTTGAAGQIVISGDGVKTLQTTGDFPSGIVSGSVIISGLNGNTAVTTGAAGQLVISGNTGFFALTTNLQATGSNLQGQITSLSTSSATGQAVIFDSGIQQGVTRQSFSFPINFNLPPYVITQVKNLGNTGAGVPTVYVSGVTTSGFSGVYDLPFNTTGYTLTIYAASGAFAPLSISPTQVRGVSFFSSFSITGNFLQEAIIPTQMTVTGYAIGVTTSGVGGAHQNSGASGLILQYPMTGNFYTRDQSNVTTTITGFTFDSGILFKSSGITSTTVPALNRVGLSIVSGLSGVANISFSLNGYI